MSYYRELCRCHLYCGGTSSIKSRHRKKKKNHGNVVQICKVFWRSEEKNSLPKKVVLLKRLYEKARGVYLCKSNIYIIYIYICEWIQCERRNSVKTIILSKQSPETYAFFVDTKESQWFNANNSPRLHSSNPEGRMQFNKQFNKITTPPKTNQLAHENGWLEYFFPFGFRPIFRCYVSFREGIYQRVDTTSDMTHIYCLICL